MSHRCRPQGTIGPVKDKEFPLMKHLESNTVWLNNEVYIIDEDSVGSAGSEKGGAAVSCSIRECPLEQVRGSPTLKDGQDADKELSRGKSFQENK